VKLDIFCWGEERKLTVFENRVLRKILGRGRDKVMRDVVNTT
jgi:hypothetical protein